MISKSELESLAKKLMFEMNDDEYETLEKEFDVILKQMDLIGNIKDIDKVEPMIFPFDLELNDEQSEVVFVHDFADVTSEQNFSVTNKGTGKGLGYLALTALQSLKYS